MIVVGVFPDRVVMGVPNRAATARFRLAKSRCKICLSEVLELTANRLLEKIEALPPEKRAEVEHFVDDLAGTSSAPGQAAKGPTFPLGLLDEINAERDALFRDHGLFDTQSILRDRS